MSLDPAAHRKEIPTVDPLPRARVELVSSDGVAELLTLDLGARVLPRDRRSVRFPARVERDERRDHPREPHAVPGSFGNGRCQVADHLSEGGDPVGWILLRAPGFGTARRIRTPGRCDDPAAAGD